MCRKCAENVQGYVSCTHDTARKEKIRSNKKKVGIELEKPTFESGAIQIFDYADRIPATSEAFHEALQALYAQHDAVLPATQVFEKAPLDLYTVFKLVASRGGYAATTVHKYGMFPGGVLFSACVCRECCVVGVFTSPQHPGSGRKWALSIVRSWSRNPTCPSTSRSATSGTSLPTSRC